MKKIVFMMPFFQTGGIERTLLNAVKALHKDYKIKLIIDQNPVPCRIYDDLKKLNVSITILSQNYVIPPKPKRFLKRKIWRFKHRKFLKLKKENPLKQISKICQNADLIVDFFSSSQSAVLKKLNLPIPQICWYHCSIKAAQHYKLFDFRKNYKKIVGLTKIFCDELKLLYPECDIIHINNPIDIELIIKESQKKLPQELINQPYFASVARLAEDKDNETLIYAYNKFLQKTNSKTKLYLIGTGNKKDYLNQIVHNLKLEEHILFLGNQSNPYPFMKNAKACILSSESEASPCVLIESMICETLPVCSDCPTGPKELLDNGNRGILFPVKDIDKLAEILEQIDTGLIDINAYQKNWGAYVQQLSFSYFKKIFEKEFFEK